MLYDLIIIGGGPAGITAGIYADRKRIKALLITKNFIGQVGESGEVDNYPGLPGISGLELAQKFESHLKKFNIEIIEGEGVIKVKKDEKKGLFWLKTDKGKKFEAKTIIVAVGADPRPLEVPGEKKFIGKGVSYCSICDAPVFRNKRVVVVGGGNSGFEAALDLAKYAKKIFVFEKLNKLRADESLQELAAENKKIEIHTNREIKKIEGKEMVESVVCQDLKTNETFRLSVDGVFVQIGTVPATSFLKGLVEFSKRDEIKVNFETCQTSCPGLFAAGDANNGHWKQVIIAAAEGARAALSAYEYLRHKC